MKKMRMFQQKTEAGNEKGFFVSLLIGCIVFFVLGIFLLAIFCFLALMMEDPMRAVPALALTALKDALTNAEEAIAKSDSALTAAEALKNGASTQTLKDAIKAVYDANNIVPSNKKSDWAKQRSILLHKAEELLMKDMPVIPVVFNQDAVLVNSAHLKKVSSSYYTPAVFTKTKLKNYTDYFYYNEEEEKNISIFKNFPTAEWDKIGK